MVSNRTAYALYTHEFVGSTLQTNFPPAPNFIAQFWRGNSAVWKRFKIEQNFVKVSHV